MTVELCGEKRPRERAKWAAKFGGNGIEWRPVLASMSRVAEDGGEEGGGGRGGRGRGNEIGRDFLHLLLLRCTRFRMVKTAVRERWGLSISDRTRGILTGEEKIKRDEQNQSSGATSEYLAPRGQIGNITACIVRSCSSRRRHDTRSMGVGARCVLP